MNNGSETILSKVIGCARCSQDHTEMEFNRFEYEPIKDTDGTLWNYWGLCPITKEPILLKFEMSE